MSAKFPRGGGGSRTFFSSKSINFYEQLLEFHVSAEREKSSLTSGPEMYS